jgi:hypothetical protein
MSVMLEAISREVPWISWLLFAFLVFGALDPIPDPPALTPQATHAHAGGGIAHSTPDFFDSTVCSPLTIAASLAALFWFTWFRFDLPRVLELRDALTRYASNLSPPVPAH